MVSELPALLHRLEHTPAAPDAAWLAADCEGLADALLGLGATAAAARWRTFALLPPAPPQLAAALADVRLQLARLGVMAPENTGPQPLPDADPLTQARAILDGRQPLPPPAEVAVLAEALLAADDPDRALQLLRLQAAIGRLHPYTCLVVASLLVRLQQPWDGERWFTAGLERLPQAQQTPSQWFQLARLLLQLHQWDEALSAVEQGLALDSTSDWGRNLRARILLAGGGRHSFDQLASRREGLPADLALQHSLQQERCRWSRPPLGPSPPPDPPFFSLSQRLQLRRQLPSPQLLVLLHGHGADPLRWLLAQDLLPPGVTVQPLASREPLVLGPALASAGFQVCPEQPSSHLAALAAADAQPVDLLVVQRPGNGRLPAELGRLLPKVRCLLAPVHLVCPPGFAIGFAHAGWQLFQQSPLTPK